MEDPGHEGLGRHPQIEFDQSYVQRARAMAACIYSNQPGLAQLFTKLFTSRQREILPLVAIGSGLVGDGKTGEKAGGDVDIPKRGTEYERLHGTRRHWKQGISRSDHPCHQHQETKNWHAWRRKPLLPDRN